MPTLRDRTTHYLLLIAALPILGFQFGIGNQVEQFTIIRRLADPAFAAGDFYVDNAALFGPRYYYSLALAWLTHLAPLPAVIFVLSFLTNFALAAVSFHTARRHLNASVTGGAVAALVAVTNSGFALGLAAYLRFESYQPASPAIVLALIAFACLLSGRRLLAAVTFIGASLAHPLVGVETAVVAYGACALAEFARQPTRRDVWTAWRGYIPSGLLLVAGVAAAWALPARGTPATAIPDAEFIRILAQFRAPHHYFIDAMPATQFLHAGVFVVVTAWLVAGHLRAEGRRFAPVALGLAAAFVVLLCVVSVITVDLMHLRLFTTAQLFRTLLVLKWVGLLFFAARADTWLGTGQPLAWVAAAVPVLCTGEAQPAALAAAVTTMEVSRRLRLRGAPALAVAGLLILMASVMLMRGDARDTGRAVVGLVVLAAWFGAAGDRLGRRIGAVALVATMIALGVVNRRVGYDAPGAVLEPTYTFDDIRTPDADMARWVGRHTPRDVVWIIPPDLETFRLFAERAVVVDFTSVPFEDQALREWDVRIRAVYGDVEGGGFTALRAMKRHYAAADPARLRAAARRYGATHAVLYADTPWAGPVLYETDGFKAVSLLEEAP